MWTIGDMWHHVIREKSKWLDKWIGIIQVNQWKVDMWQESTLPFGPSWTKRWGERKKREGKKKRKEKERVVEREALLSL